MSDFTSATARAYPVSTLEHLLREQENRVLRAKADAYDDLSAGVRWLLEVMGSNGLRDIGHNATEPVKVKADGAEPEPTEAQPIPAADADPFAAAPTEPQPQPRRSGRRSRRTEEGQPAPQDAQPVAEPTPDEGQPLTAEALGLTAEPAAQPLPLPVVEAPDVSAAPQSADDVYGTEPAEDPFA